MADEKVMISEDGFEPMEEADAAIALYGQILCSLIRRLARKGVLDGGDAAALVQTVERFREEDEHLPAVVERHVAVLVEFLGALPGAGGDFTEV